MQVTDYSWFDEELARVKWKTFYVIRQNVTPEMLSQIGLDRENLASDYYDFLIRYGEVKLFRVLNSDGCRLTIVIPDSLAKGTTLPMLRIGGYWVEGDAYLLEDDCRIFTIHGNRPHPIGENFSTWFKGVFYRAKKEYKKTEWRMLESPPAPFDPDEQRIAEAIPKYRFEKVGVESNGDLKFTVYNGSDSTLQHVEVGVKAPNLRGALFLDVSDLRPGQTKTITRPCYKNQVDPQTVELFTFPKPTPEDRFAFKELASRSASAMRVKKGE